ncbi:hypothetical protein, partial [Enterococcus faecium]|uniref:hypothetical protein n=1 Tax=Enterococcus faecium TaxID=1352 RepID=UPI003F44188B
SVSLNKDGAVTSVTNPTDRGGGTVNYSDGHVTSTITGDGNKVTYGADGTATVSAATRTSNATDGASLSGRVDPPAGSMIAESGTRSVAAV